MEALTITLDTRLIDMTAGQLIELVRSAMTEEQAKAATVSIDSRLNSEPQVQPLFGIEGMAIALGVSKPTAQRWKSLGYLDGGYQQIGHTIRIDNPQALRDIAAASVRKAKATEKRRGRRISYSLLNQ